MLPLRVGSLHVPMTWNSSGRVLYCVGYTGAASQQQGDQGQGGDAQQAGQEDHPGPQLHAAVELLPDDGGGGGGGHGQHDQGDAHHQGVHLGEEAHAHPADHREDQQPGEGGGDGVPVPDHVGHLALGQIHAGDHHGQGGGHVGQVLQGGEEGVGDGQLTEIEDQAQDDGGVQRGHQRRAQGEAPFGVPLGGVHAHHPHADGVQQEVEGDIEKYRQHQPVRPKQGIGHRKAHEAGVGVCGAAAPHPPPAVWHPAQPGQGKGQGGEQGEEDGAEHDGGQPEPEEARVIGLDHGDEHGGGQGDVHEQGAERLAHLGGDDLQPHRREAHGDEQEESHQIGKENHNVRMGSPPFLSGSGRR